ncbi:MAG TPA: thioredoxin domain-containing protein [bacterium]|nr:thioredoxin domain-containing protein [bacterium]
MKIFNLSVLFFFLFTFSLSAWDEGADSYDSIKARAKTSEVPFIVYVRVDWCPWCKKLDSLLQESDFDQLFYGKLAVKINPDNSPEEKMIAKSLGVTGYPSMYIILPNGGKSSLGLPLKAEKETILLALKKQLSAVFKE